MNQNGNLRIHVISAYDADELQDQENLWLEENPVQILSIQFSATAVRDDRWMKPAHGTEYCAHIAYLKPTSEIKPDPQS